jgi:DNA replicative helicase MCM subunit Mcm2 (Cdc46/Mcm family)
MKSARRPGTVSQLFSATTDITTTATRCCSTTTTATMMRSERPRFPADVFNINDHVKCKNLLSKHCGHTVRVIGHVGKFIDWRDAELTKTRFPTNVATISTDTTTTADDNIQQLTHLLEHMAFTAATVISSEHGNSRRMEHLLTLFERQVRDQANVSAAARIIPHTTASTAPPGVSHVPPNEM